MGLSRLAKTRGALAGIEKGECGWRRPSGSLNGGSNLHPRLLRIAAAVLWLWGWGVSGAIAGPLGDRVAAFPQWRDKPPVQAAAGDLVYPDWLAGTWQVSDTLEDLVSPLAPELVTPGFEGNRRYLHQPIAFQVRFAAATDSRIVADRAFNGMQIASAYLGEGAVRSLKVDPNNPNRQITQLRNEGELVSIVTGRGSERPEGDRFIATEVTQQLFRSPTQIYLNEVETTTAYRRAERDRLEAEQLTAIYLSPRDPDYFKAGNRPVALYRYRLMLTRSSARSPQSMPLD